MKHKGYMTIDGVDCCNTRTVNKDLPFTLSVIQIAALGIEPHSKIKAGCWFRLTDVPLIHSRIIDKLQALEGKS